MWAWFGGQDLSCEDWSMQLQREYGRNKMCWYDFLVASVSLPPEATLMTTFEIFSNRFVSTTYTMHYGLLCSKPPSKIKINLNV